MNIYEERRDPSGNTYTAILPMRWASHEAVNGHVAETVREYLSRHGVPEIPLTDVQLLARIRRTFGGRP